jgi:hypothetical protein
MIIVHKNSILTVGDIWYESTPAEASVDLVACYQSARPMNSIWSREFYTIAVDLAREEDQIFAGMGKTNRYKISRAQKRDGLRYEWWHQDSESVLDEFMEFFAGFARSVGLQMPQKAWLRSYARAGVLDISRISDEQSRILCWHTHYRENSHARLFHSASSFREFDDPAMRSLTGRANRFQHWQDMLRFKAADITTYDLGGWYEGRDDQERLRINRFKEEFGGQVVKAFNSIQPMTLRGRAYLVARLIRHPNKRLIHMV